MSEEDERRLTQADSDINEKEEEERLEKDGAVAEANEEGQESIQAGVTEEGQQQQEAAAAATTTTTATTMSPEHTLLLQVLRRAKRQQDLITQIQKSLKTLASIEKSIGKATEQVRLLQSAIRDSQRQITQIQHQVAALEKAQAKGFQKIAKQKSVAITSVGRKKAPSTTITNKRKKSKSEKK